jgi:hypothetical protein
MASVTMTSTTRRWRASLAASRRNWTSTARSKPGRRRTRPLLGFVEPGGSPDVEGFHNRQRLDSALGYTNPANKEDLTAAA